MGKSFFGLKELEYLSYWITREGEMPVPNKVYMWEGRAEKLAPLTVLTSKKAKWKWTDVEQQAFDAVKTAVAKNILLVYPDFNEKFKTHTYASKHQLGA
eukprot:12195997-Ditylum_brightwellii.AAC.1